MCHIERRGGAEIEAMAVVGKLVVEADGERGIGIRRHFAAPPEAVFDALTTAATVAEWMHPPGWRMARSEVDLRPGGTFRHVMANDQGELGWGGTFLEMERPHLLVHDELFDEDWTGGRTLVRTALTAADGGTDFHAVVVYASREARDRVLASPMEQGMAIAYDQLEDLLARSAS